MLARNASGSRPENGATPYSAWYRETQKLNWSEAAVAVSPASCSGAMYASVPRISPLAVSEGGAGPGSGAPGSIATAATARFGNRFLPDYRSL
jgi:hypothetical protein